MLNPQARCSFAKPPLAQMDVPLSAAHRVNDEVRAVDLPALRHDGQIGSTNPGHRDGLISDRADRAM